MTEPQILARSDHELMALVGAGALAGALLCLLIEGGLKLFRKLTRGY